jgi:cytochrome c
VPKNPSSSAPLALLASALFVAACAASRRSGASAPAVEAQLCDGETVIALERVPTTRAEGQAAADAMMAAWKAKNPGVDWEQEVRSRHWIAPAHDNSGVLAAGQGSGHPGRAFSERDLLVWERETERLVVAGARIFHSGDELGSTIAVSCDMCHPDAANTHPETYPKYQTQIGKAVLLRDMINWCLEHPVRARPLAEDDPKMRALEAYIYAQRSGTPLAYGKH